MLHAEMTPAEQGIAAAREEAQDQEKKPYVVKFYHINDDETKEEMFLCLNGKTLYNAAEKFWQITGGVDRLNVLISVTGSEGIEAWWLPKEWKFVTIPPAEKE